LDRGKTVADNVDGSVICKEYSGVGRKHRREIIDKNREESRTKYRSLGDTSGGKARGRARVSNTGDVTTI
jgi:hypothetical protein